MPENEDIKIFNEIEANQFLRNVLLIAAGLFLSFIFIRSNYSKESKPTKFDELLAIIKENYVDSIQIDYIEKNAVSRLLNSLDPHSVYISKDELKSANEFLEGNFSGVGIEFFIARDTIIVVSPISGGPSELAGIKSGDKIIKINDTLVAGVKISNADVYKKLRGERESKVKLTVMRGQKLLSSFVLKRDNIKVNSVEPAIMIDTNIGYIKINEFGENTYSEFYDQLVMLKINPKFNSLVIDLRQNTGGFLEIAAAILDELIADRQLLVYTEGRHYPKEQFFSKKKGIFEHGKLAILIDEGSASASEILAGAVQDLDRGVIIGRRSFGKGLVQNQIPLSDGGAVRLTIAKYYTPSGRNIQKPYKSNENYEEEIYERYKNGEFFDETKELLNKDTTVYRTTKGRKVKAGGGIYPDYFVPLDTNYDFHNFSILRSVVPDFIYSNYQKFEPQIANYKSSDEFLRKYSITPKIMNEFYTYAKNNGAKWTENRKSSYEGKLKLTLKSFLAKQFYGSEGFYKSLNQTDNVILKAKNIFKTIK